MKIMQWPIGHPNENRFIFVEEFLKDFSIVNFIALCFSTKR